MFLISSSDGNGDDPLAFPSTSSAGSNASATEEDIDKLSEMFPNETRKELENCLKVQGTLRQAVTTLLQSKTSLELSDDDSDLMDSVFEGPRSLSEELHDLPKNFDNGQKEKLKVDEEDLLNDAMTYYKDSDFNPSKRLRIVYTGQAAADTGGVVRHFYTQLLTGITETFFQGKEYCSPIYNSDTVASGLMKLVGTIIVHSILQGGPGLPVFSPGIYYYLATGNVEEAIDGLAVIDCSLEMRDFISKVINNLQYDTTHYFYFPNQLFCPRVPVTKRTKQRLNNKLQENNRSQRQYNVKSVVYCYTRHSPSQTFAVWKRRFMSLLVFLSKFPSPYPYNPIISFLTTF